MLWSSLQDKGLLVRAFKDNSIDNKDIGNYGDTFDQTDFYRGDDDSEAYVPPSLQEIPKEQGKERSFKRSNIMSKNNYLKYTGRDRFESFNDNVRFGNTADYQTNGYYRGKIFYKVKST